MILAWVLVMWVRTLLLLITTLEDGSRVVMRGGDEGSRVVRKDTFTKQNTR
jgi:hypothetical protein